MKTKVNDLLKTLQDDGFGNTVDIGKMTDAELDLLETRQEVAALRQELADLAALVGALQRDAKTARLREKHMRKELNHFHAWCDSVDGRAVGGRSGGEVVLNKTSPL